MPTRDLTIPNPGQKLTLTGLGGALTNLEPSMAITVDGEVVPPLGVYAIAIGKQSINVETFHSAAVRLAVAAAPNRGQGVALTDVPLSLVGLKGLTGAATVELCLFDADLRQIVPAGGADFWTFTVPNASGQTLLGCLYTAYTASDDVEAISNAAGALPLSATGSDVGVNFAGGQADPTGAVVKWALGSSTFQPVGGVPPSAASLTIAGGGSGGEVTLPDGTTIMIEGGTLASGTFNNWASSSGGTNNLVPNGMKGQTTVFVLTGGTGGNPYVEVQVCWDNDDTHWFSVPYYLVSSAGSLESDGTTALFASFPCAVVAKTGGAPRVRLVGLTTAVTAITGAWYDVSGVVDYVRYARPMSGSGLSSLRAMASCRAGAREFSVASMEYTTVPFARVQSVAGDAFRITDSGAIGNANQVWATATQCFNGEIKNGNPNTGNASGKKFRLKGYKITAQQLTGSGGTVDGSVANGKFLGIATLYTVAQAAGIPVHLFNGGNETVWLEDHVDFAAGDLYIKLLDTAYVRLYLTLYGNWMN